MASILGALRGAVTARTPVPYVAADSARGLGILSRRGDDNKTQALGAMTSTSTLFAIVDATSQAVASARWRLWRKSKTGRPEDRVEVTAHAALDLLRRPNPFMTQQELFEASQQHQDLTGEAWWVLNFGSGRGTLPLEIWPVRPDKMNPVPHPTDYLSGYTYDGPDGEKVPLDVEEVIFVRRPNPLDPYRGIGPVQAVLVDIDSAKYSAEWNRNFFINGAEPGGIVQVDRMLSDPEFNTLRARWAEQHQGVARAHRVAILEAGQWVDRKFSQKDMQFVELRDVSREVIREAFRFPKPMLGTVEDVNRANADAAEVVFGRWLTVPRLDRFRQALNNDLLPLFYRGVNPGAIDVEFDYDRESVVPDDRVGEAAWLTSATGAAVALMGAGFDKEDTLRAFGLPIIELAEVEEPEPAEEPNATPPGAPEPDADPAEEEPGEMPEEGSAEDRLRRFRPGAFQGAGLWRPEFAPVFSNRVPRRILNEVPPELAAHQADWNRALKSMMSDNWPEINEAWRAELLDKIEDMAAGGSLLSLLGLAIDSTGAADLLEAAMMLVGQHAADNVVDEAWRKAHTSISPVYPSKTEVSVLAQVAMAQLAAEWALSASNEAVRISGPYVTAAEVKKGVDSHLKNLSDARPALKVGGALSAAQQDARLRTLANAPVEAYYATEVLDTNTCKFCRAVDGRWLGNTMAEAHKLYPRNGYIDCEGRERCRGTVTAVYRPEQTSQP